MEFLQEYLDQVMSYMTLGRRDKLTLIERIRPELEEQLEGQTICSYADVEELLGAPEDMAEELTATMPYKDRIKKDNRRQKVLVAVICGLLIVAAVTAAICIQVSKNQPGYYTVAVSEDK